MPGCLVDLKSVGLPWQLEDLGAAALAAKARRVRLESEAALAARRRARRLLALTGLDGWRCVARGA